MGGATAAGASITITGAVDELEEPARDAESCHDRREEAHEPSEGGDGVDAVLVQYQVTVVGVVLSVIQFRAN